MRYFIRIQLSLYVNADIDEGEVEKVDFKVVWKKNTYDVSFPLDERVDKLKEHISTLCGELFNEHHLKSLVRFHYTQVSHQQ